jgi:hypothetical protein
VFSISQVSITLSFMTSKLWTINYTLESYILTDDTCNSHVKHLTYSMEQSPSWVASSLWATKENSGLLCSRRFITVFIEFSLDLAEFSPHSHNVCPSFHLWLRLSYALLPSDCPAKILYVFLISPHPSYSDLTTVIIFYEAHKLLNSIVCRVKIVYSLLSIRPNLEWN